MDPRADLFALGTIVYEMASGRRAFKGDSQASLIAAILERDPEPLSNVQPSVPPGLDRLVRKCLVKDPNARWQSATDVADELRWIAGGSGSSGGPQRRRRTARFVAIATALVLAGGGAVWRYWRAAPPAPGDVQHRQITFTGDIGAAALSPDGRSIAYVAGQATSTVQVFVRDLAGGQALPIWSGRTVSAVAWLNNGDHVAVSGIQEKNGLWILPRLGRTRDPWRALPVGRSPHRPTARLSRDPGRTRRASTSSR